MNNKGYPTAGTPLAQPTTVVNLHI